MADVYELKVELRERAGKGSSRAARRNGLVPAVIYGDKKSPNMINIPRNELVRVIRRGGFLTHLFELDVAGAKEKVLPRDLQLHPVTDEPLHVDFLRLSKGAKIVIEVPVIFVDEDKAEGLTRGGVLNIVRHTIECNVPMDSIPESFEISLAGMDIGDSVHISAVKMPEGVEPTVTDRDFTVATIAAPTALTAEEEAEGEEDEEGEEGEEGEGETAEEGAKEATEGDGEAAKEEGGQ